MNHRRKQLFLSVKPGNISTHTLLDSLFSPNVLVSKFDLTHSMNTSVNSAHAQFFNTTHQNKTLNHDQRAVTIWLLINISTNAASK